MPAYVGAECLKKPHHIVTLQFSEVVKDHANYIGQDIVLTPIVREFYRNADSRSFNKKKN